ncbi:hypothetical protein LINPERPRIM_LOCUS39608 [Linum perenne]
MATRLGAIYFSDFRL